MIYSHDAIDTLQSPGITYTVALSAFLASENYYITVHLYLQGMMLSRLQ